MTPRLFENGTTYFLETGGWGPTLAMLTMLTTLCTPAAAMAVAAETVEAVAEKMVDSTDEAVEAPTRAVLSRPRLLVAMAAAPKPLAYVH